MARNLVCSECGGRLQVGCVPDHIYGYGMVDPTIWVEGKFERTFWGALKTKDRKIYYVHAYRCERCGLLKLYADPDNTSVKQE